MPNIRTISDLRNHAVEISRICHEGGEPVFVTRNGRADLVVLSQAAYDQLQDRLGLYEKLGQAEADAARRDRSMEHKAMMRSLRCRPARSGC